MNWINSTDKKPERYGLYLVTDNLSWYVKLINKGTILRYEEWDDGYGVDPEWKNREWWWQELPERPDGENPYYDR